MWLDDVRAFSPGPSGASAPVAGDAFHAFGIDRTGRGAAVTERVRASLPYGVLRTFACTAAPARRVLVVAPLAGGFPFLMRDLVVALLDIAGEVGVTDWPNARYVPVARGPFGLADNCMETAQMARALGAAGPAAPVHIVGVCQGAVPALAAGAILAAAGEPPASVTLMGGPIDPSRNPTRLWRVLQERSLPALRDQVIETVGDAFPGVGRSVFPAWRQIETFGLYLWRQTLTGQELPLKIAFDEGDSPLSFPLARLCWTMMDVPGEFFMDNVATIFRDNALFRGTFHVAGRTVRPSALTRTALLTVEAADDDISATGQTEAAHDVCDGLPEPLRHRLRVPRAGHFSLFYGRAMRTMILPEIAAAMAAGERARAEA